MNKPSNQFKHGDWVIGDSGKVIFKVEDIRVFGESYGYSGDSIDGWWSEHNLIGFPVKQRDIEEALAHLSAMRRRREENEKQK